MLQTLKGTNHVSSWTRSFGRGLFRDRTGSVLTGAALAVGLTVAPIAQTVAGATGPIVNISSANGHPSGSFTVSGSGFGDNEVVDLYWDTTDEELAVTTATGTFGGILLSVPASATPGTHWVTAEGRTSHLAAQRPFVVSTSWSEFGFTAQGLHYNPYENVLNPSTVSGIDEQWNFATGGAITSEPAVVGAVVYATSSDDSIYAINASNGTSKWKYTTSGDLSGSPAVSNGVVYVGSQDANIYAINGSNGTLKWKYTTGLYIEASPAISGGVVYATSGDGYLYALSASTGALVWKYNLSSTGFSSPAVANGVVYVGNEQGVLYAINAATGALKWSYPTGGEIDSSPAVADGVVYVGSNIAGDNNLYAVNAGNGALKWSYTLDSTGIDVYSAPAVANGTVYIGSEDGSLYALNAASGSVKWSYPAGFSIDASPAVADGVVYIGTANGDLDAFDTNGNLLTSVSTGGSIDNGQPGGAAVANGVVYFGSSDDNLYAYALGTEGYGVIRPDPSHLRPNPALRPQAA